MSILSCRYECMTLSQLLDLKAQSSGRLGAKHVTDDGSPRKRIKAPLARKAVVQPAKQFQPADVSGVKVEGEISPYKEFDVESKPKLLRFHPQNFYRDL